MASRAAWILLAGTGAVWGASFAGASFPPGDSLAVFRPISGLALGILLLLWGWRGLKLALVVALVTVVSMRFGHAPEARSGAAFRVHQHNMMIANQQIPRLKAVIARSAPDIVTLQEVPLGPIGADAVALKGYEARVLCAHRAGREAVLSRWPILAQGCGSAGRFAWARVDLPQGAVTVVSLHQLWPWPYPQMKQLPRIAREIAALEGPVIVAGDFNMVPWGASVRAIKRAAQGRLAVPDGATRMLGPVGLVIDHVIVPEGWGATARRTDKLGSDHWGLDLRITRP